MITNVISFWKSSLHNKIYYLNLATKLVAFHAQSMQHLLKTRYIFMAFLWSFSNLATIEEWKILQIKVKKTPKIIWQIIWIWHLWMGSKLFKSTCSVHYPIHCCVPCSGARAQRCRSESMALSVDFASSFQPALQRASFISISKLISCRMSLEETPFSTNISSNNHYLVKTTKKYWIYWNKQVLNCKF